ncbi:MAG TPA: hypothetical protein VF775_07140 [Geobacteraceae bacterium]
MRFAPFIVLLLVFATQALGAAQDDTQLRHDWKETRENGEVRLISNFPAPFPFSTTGEPESTLAIDAEKISPEVTSLAETMKSEVQQIRKGLQIADYLEEDGKKPDRGIVTYYEEINGQRVGFIKYRTIGVLGEPAVMPRSVRHAIFIKRDTVYFIHLVVLFAGHEEEVRSDQIRIIKRLIGP